MTEYQAVYKSTSPQTTVAINAKNEVIYAGRGEPPDGFIGEQATIINGDLGELLFEALTGRSIEESPTVAEWSRAAAAREVISEMALTVRFGRNQHNRLDALNTVVAQVVLSGRLRFIQPWLGTTKLDEFGVPQIEAPEHWQIITTDAVTATSLV